MHAPTYAAPGVTLYCGKAETVLPQLPAASVALICVDPPYFRVKDEAWDRQWQDEAAYLGWLEGLCQEWQRILQPNGSLYCFASPLMATPVECVIRHHFHFLNRITWVKADGWHKKAEKEDMRSYLSAWEAILFAEHYGDQYAEQAHALHKVVYAPLGRYLQAERERAGVTRDAVDVALGYVRSKDPTRGTELCRRWEEGSSLPTKDTYSRLRDYLNSRNGHHDFLRKDYEDLRKDYEDLRRPFTVTAQDQYTDVWTFAPVQPAPGKHPCEKPLPLLRQIILASSRPGDTVLDCCAGRGSTLDAARECGRVSIGIEQDPQWCARSVQRLRQEWLPLQTLPQPAAIQQTFW